MTLVERLRGMTVDWDGSRMKDEEEPRSIPSCGDLRAAADEITRLTAENERLREALDAKWRPIRTAPTLDRVFVAGWQKPTKTGVGYWWTSEDMTDEKGIPMDHPDALFWQPMPAMPTRTELEQP